MGALGVVDDLELIELGLQLRQRINQGLFSLDPPTQVRAGGRYPGSALSRFLA